MSDPVTAIPSSPLDDAIIKLISIVDISKQAANEALDAFVALTVLLTELKRDQATLRRVRAENGTNAIFPPPHEIPAISAVTQNPLLFCSLLRCLLTATGGSGEMQESVVAGASSGNHPNHQHHHHHHHHPTHQHHHHANKLVRKRSLSGVADATIERANKALKSSHSPLPSARHKLQLPEDSTNVPSFNPHVVSATILYAAFQHFDHWPVQFVRAYAEDCFGPRLWVDDEHCSSFVANLALAHDECLETEEPDQQKVSDASLVAEAFRRIEELGHLAGVEDDSQARRRASKDSISLSGSTPNFGLKSQQSLLSDDSTESAGIKNSRISLEMNDDSGRGTMAVAQCEGNQSSASGHSDNNGNGDQPPRHFRNGNVTALADENPDKSRGERVYSIVQRFLIFSRIRQRYFGVNLSYAQECISSALSGRLEQKSRQNSGLLQSLSSFTTIPAVRFMIAENLEQWLKSPALAGLARSLFSATVNHMKNIDPPLEEDIKAIDCILAMKLKANQLNAHIENVTAIARQIPVASVAHHIYSNLLREALSLAHSDDASNMSELRMIGAIHKEINPLFSYDALAAVLLTELVASESHDEKASKSTSKERVHLVKKLRLIIRAMSFELGPLFDGCQLIAALLSLDVSSDSWSSRDEEDKARLMFQCAILSVNLTKKEADGSISVCSEGSFRQSLNKAKKLLLTWCCSDFGPRCMGKSEKSTTLGDDDDSIVVGAGLPDFSSALCPASEDERVPSWLCTMRCLLFLEDAESPLMKRFLEPDAITAEDDWNDEVMRIRLCCANGGDVSDELIWIVLKSASSDEGVDASMAITLLENLFENCSKGHNGSLEVKDPMIVWELYNLVQYHPTKSISSLKSKKSGDSSADMDSRSFPRLAYPGLWWRVTMLALVLCGCSPKNVGYVVWNDHPTLQALMKMITSSRYRFPTVDCDEITRIKMKDDEQMARDKEVKVAETLFLPKEQEKTKNDAKGFRVSRRILKQQQEKEAAKELAELNRRKKLLRNAQKTIMLWDPDGPARKPPRESVDLLLSVEELFGLSEVFQGSTDPDFLLMTIGQTSRGAIERAYDWLIPIISTVPSTIARLPSSASCFLLLRAYGTDGDERKQLKPLTAPLLVHVKDSLNGKYGEADSVKAFDLLMADVACAKAERRRCARRVLQDALEQDEDADGNSQSWMLNVLKVDFAKSFIVDAIKHLSTAAGYERGRVLRAILISLEQHFMFAGQQGIELEVTFPQRLTHLISSRPGVCADAMDAFPDLWGMAIRVTYAEFLRYLDVKFACRSENADLHVVLKIVLPGSNEVAEVMIPLALLQSICVCLSIWKNDDVKFDVALNDAVQILTDYVLGRVDDFKDDNVGLSGAVLKTGGASSVSVESWIMLAKARSDVIARRAALSAPSFFLPRLLLCSGLPRSSLLTMIDRLGRIGEAAQNKGQTYIELLIPKAASEWDIGRVGNRHELIRKLLGRLSAYMRLFDVSLGDEKTEVSPAFLIWLAEECQNNQRQSAKKSKVKKEKSSGPHSLSTVEEASFLLSQLENERTLPTKKTKLVKKDICMNDFMQCKELSVDASDESTESNDIINIVDRCIQSSNYIQLDTYLENEFRHLEESVLQDTVKRVDLAGLCASLLNSALSVNSPPAGMTVVLLKWIPRFSRFQGLPDFWELIFSSKDDRFVGGFLNILSLKCVAAWSIEQGYSCAEWILNECQSNPAKFDSARVVLFLISVSEQTSSQVESVTASVGCQSFLPEWRTSKELVVTAASVALSCLKESNSGELLSALSCRNSLPPGLILILLVAKFGKMQLQAIANLILKEASAPGLAPDLQNMFDIILLRLYLFHPYWMDLGSSELRAVLMHASENHYRSWIEWRSSLDDVLMDMVTSLLGGELRISKSLSDFSRRHPLLVLRRLPNITCALELDATCSNCDLADAKGLVVGQNIAGQCDASFDGKVVKVSIKHWGYSFMEPVWNAFLDIVSVIPREVLFTCGAKVGLLDFLGIYVQLMSVQLQLMSAGKVSRLKGKLLECFSVFQQCNLSVWRRWLGLKMGGESEIRHLLLSGGFITPQEAMGSVKHPE